ncbi:MAG: hypothetical protein K2K02_03930, partial [Ruminococcus sp.]|nr:hypothetical protein [Ruminococcus sp.]
NLSETIDFVQIMDELEQKYNIVSSYTSTRPQTKPISSVNTAPQASKSTNTSNSEPWTQLRSHVYQDMNHKNLAIKTIYRKPDESKTAMWQRYESGTLIKGLNGLQMPLYHVYNITDNAKPVFVVEGEKDVETMEKLGYIATTSPNGAGSKWKSEYTPIFNDFDVVILADNDEAGLKYATNIAENLIQTARSVKLVPSQSLYTSLQPKGDISDIVDIIGLVKAKNLLKKF